MNFSRQSRLLRPSEFKRVFQHPMGSKDRCFRVLARANSVHQHRLGMAVSKKVCPTAVGRNRIKRVVRESFRNRIAGQKAVNDLFCALDFVVLPTAQSVGQTNKSLEQSLGTHWQNLIGKADQQKTLKTEQG